MIYIKIIGGLGNQLFQYVLAENLKKKNKILLCKDFFENYEYHKLSINNLKLKIRFANKHQTKKFKIFGSNILTTKIFMFSRKIFKLINFILIKNYVYEENTDINKIIKKYNKSYLFDGYWQNYILVNNCRKTIQRIFKIKLKKNHIKLIKDIKSKNSVAIHIRTFSLQGNKRANLNLSKKYYLKSINFMKKKIKNPFFFVFSDSPVRAKKMLQGQLNNILFVEKFDEIQDLISISRCKNQIMSNSTFSWWGAWLNKNSNKIVVYPKKNWHKDTNLKLLIPDCWHKI